jgi:hypothetical protein
MVGIQGLKRFHGGQNVPCRGSRLHVQGIKESWRIAANLRIAIANPV